MMTSPSPDEWNLLLRETAQAWGLRPDDDVLKLLKVHSSPDATMSVPPTAA